MSKWSYQCRVRGSTRRPVTTIRTLSPYRFHDVQSYLSLVQAAAPDILPEAVVYLEEAIAAFYADCLLSSCVMLGVAAEAEFLRLLNVAANGQHTCASFTKLAKDRGGPIRHKIVAFQRELSPILLKLEPRRDFEDADIRLNLIQSVIRISRNDAGHPTGRSAPKREEVYMFNQMFVPFAAQVRALRVALA
jgi:hypothetical protein